MKDQDSYFLLDSLVQMFARLRFRYVGQNVYFAALRYVGQNVYFAALHHVGQNIYSDLRFYIFTFIAWHLHLHLRYAT